MTRVPMPGECHPAYRTRVWIREWVDANPRRLPDTIVVPIYRKDPEGFAALVAVSEYTLTRRKAAAPAPYTGAPFVYMWYYAVDHVGRAVAGQARIHPTPFRPPWGDQ